jgi:hypothetical protein
MYQFSRWNYAAIQASIRAHYYHPRYMTLIRPVRRRGVESRPRVGPKVFAEPFQGHLAAAMKAILPHRSPEQPELFRPLEG